MTLQADYEACMEAFDHSVMEMTDFDGSYFTVYKDGWEQIAHRMTMLEELMQLKQPVNLHEWCEGGLQCSWTKADYDEYEAYCTTEEPK